MELLKLEREILGDLSVSNELWKNLAYLCDVCNGRFAGTEDERRAGDYIMARFQAYGLKISRLSPSRCAAGSAVRPT